VKAKPGKVSVSSKAKSVAAKKAKPAPKKPAAKPTVKKTAKPAASKKSAAKPAAKKAAAKKPAAKPTGKKVTAKPAAKAKPVPKKAARPAVKPKAKVAAPKTAAKAKPSARPVAKTGKKPAQVAAKPLVKLPVKAALAAPAVPAPPAAPPARTSRASSRLAQLTVPSMAQSVATNAVKASYTSTMSPNLIAPPLPNSVKKDPKLANNWKTKPAEALTDAELIAMPDSEYMNDKQLAAFRVRLQLLKQDILNNAGETTEHLREDTVIVPDPADRATIEEEHALELRTRDRERKLLKKIEQSIDRIDAGDYGYCDETGEPIGVGRLLARPTATLSLEAQQRRELKQKMFGD